jgi:hypothetical protein
MDSKTGIMIGTETSHVTLWAMGPDDYGHKARASFRTAAFDLQGQLSHLTLFPEPFITALERLHDTLNGEAILESLDHDLRIRLSAETLGHVLVNVEVSSVDPTLRLAYEVGLDQTFLPPMIGSFKDAFLAH